MNSFDSLCSILGEIDTLFDNWTTKLGLSYAHFAVLYSLAANPDRETTQKQISEEYYLPKQTVFNVCKAYREKGWIELSPSTTDKRERIMRLTDAGREQAWPVLAKTNLLCDNTFAAFGTAKTEKLFELMGEFCQVCRAEIAKMEQGLPEKIRLPEARHQQNQILTYTPTG